MLIFLFKKYLTNLFSFNKPLQSFLKILFLVFMLSQGFLLALGLNAIQENHPEYTTKVLLYLNVFVFIMIVLRNIFPFYAFKNSIIPRYYTVSASKRIIADFLQDICSMVVLSMFLLVCGVCYSAFFKMQNFILSIGVILSAILIESNFKKLLEKSFKKVFLHYGIFALQIIVFFLCLKIHILFILVGFILGIIQSYLLLKNETENSAKQVYSQGISNIFSLHLKMYFKNVKLHPVLIMAISLKITVFLALSETFGNEKHFLVALYSNPIVFFTYIHMNWFGYNENLWLTFQNNSISNIKTKYLYFLPLVLPLIFDFVLTFIVMYFANKMDMRFVTFYATCTLTCVSIGYFASTENPKKVFSMANMFFNMKMYADILSTILLGIVVTISWFIMSTIFFYPFCLIVIFVSSTYFILAKQESKITFKNFQTFFNSKE